MEHLSNDQQDQCNNSYKPCSETRHPGLSLLETQWKLRLQHEQNFPVVSIIEVEERKKSKRAKLCESQSGIQV